MAGGKEKRDLLPISAWLRAYNPHKTVESLSEVLTSMCLGDLGDSFVSRLWPNKNVGVSYLFL